MRDSTRNIIVGLTILVALAASMYGIVLLGKFPGVGLRQYKVSVIADNAAGVTSGAKVELNGVVVGQSNNPYLTRDPVSGKLVVKIELLIDSGVEIPSASTVTLARPASGVGQSYVQLWIVDAASPRLPQDGTAVIQATVAESGLIPKEIIDDIHVLRDTVRDKFGPAAENLGAAAKVLAEVAKDLHVLLAYNTPEAIEKADPNDPNRPLPNASTVIIRLETTVKSLQGLLTDQKLHEQVRESIQNIADASAQLKTILTKAQNSLGNVDSTLANANKAVDAIGGAATQATSTLASAQKDLSNITQKLVETLGQLQKSVKDVTEGSGTTGKLVTDPRLYEGLIDLSKSLKTTIEDLDFLIRKWTDEGLPLRLK